MPSSEYEYTQYLMGTTVSLKLFELNEEAVRNVFNTIKLLEDKLTVNRQHSEVMSINQAAGKHPVLVSHFVFSLIEQAQKISIDPDNCFNLAMGPLVKLWKIGFHGDSVPPDDKIKKQLRLTNPNKVIFDKNNCSVYLEKPEMEIDLGAIAKGYIADIVSAVLQKYGIKQAVINLGGNVLTVGQSPLTTDGYWQIGLKKPFTTENQLVGIIKVKNKSVVTSGIYERFFVQNAHVYHHILDPATGYPLDNELDSVTIISDSSLEGDIYSTIFYGYEFSKIKQFLQKKLALSAILVKKNKEIILFNSANYSFELLDNQYVTHLID